MSNGSRDLYGRDTISRADYNPYDLRPEADMARRRLAERNISAGVDEIESDSSKLERSLIEKFQKNQFVILRTEKMGGIVTGGKFILLAFVMPAYLFLYGIPRWLLQKSFPKVAELVTKAAEQVQGLARFITQWTQNLATIVTNKAESMMGWNRGSAEAKNNRGWMHVAWDAVSAKAINAVKVTKEAIKSVFDTMGKIVSNVYHFFADPIVTYVKEKFEIVKRFYEATADVGQKVVDKVKDLAHKMVEGIKHHFDNAVQFMQSITAPVVNFAVNQYQSVSQSVANGYNYVAEKAGEVKERTAELIRSVSHAIAHTVRTKAHQAWESTKHMAQMVAAPFIAVAAWGQDQMVNLYARTVQFANSAKDVSKKSLVWFVTKALPALAKKLIPSWMNPMTWYKKGREMGKSFKRAREKIAAKIQKGLVKVMGYLQRLARKVNGLMLKLLTFFKAKALQFFKAYVNPVLSYFTPRAIGNGLKRTWRVLRLIGYFTKRLFQELLTDLST